MTRVAFRRPRWSVLLPVLFVGLGCPALLPTSARGQLPQVAFRQDTHAFRRILHEFELQPLKDLTEKSAPSNTLLIILGDPRLFDGRKILEEGPLDEFLKEGGALLLATDQAARSAPAHVMGWAVGGAFLSVDPETGFAYKDLADCPFVQGIPDRAFAPPVFKHLNRIATNMPSELLSVEEHKRLPALAVLSPDCVRAGQREPPSLQEHVFAAGGDWKQGRVLILSDHSVFINEMMLQPDNDNIDFASNCVAWLTGPGQRKQVLLVDNGQVRSELDVALVSPAPVTLNGILKELENQGTLDRLAAWHVAPHVLVGVFTVGLVVYGFLRLGRSRHRAEFAALAPAAPCPSSAPAGRIVDLRRLAILQGGNLWEPAHVLARTFFEAGNLQLGTAGARPRSSLRQPRVRAASGWVRGWRLRRWVRRLWRLAHEESGRVSGNEFRRLATRVSALKSAQAAGILQLEEVN